jgi:hypothetical protein
MSQGNTTPFFHPGGSVTGRLVPPVSLHFRAEPAIQAGVKMIQFEAGSGTSMTSKPAVELAFLKELIEVRRGDFSALYLAICELHEFVRANPSLVEPETVALLCGLLQSEDHVQQSQSRILYRETAGILAWLASSSNVAQSVAEQSLEGLSATLAHPASTCRRAASEVLGSLPLTITGPNLLLPRSPEPTRLHWQQILALCHIPTDAPPAWLGRSLVVERPTQHDLLVIKLARIDDDPAAMCREACWMEHFHANNGEMPVRFDVPKPLQIADQYLFRLADPPSDGAAAGLLHPQGFAIGFTAHRDYFCYINGAPRERELSLLDFEEALFRNAWLLGKLTAEGIVHTAPIPLFHNRVQRHRRSDLGLYEWPRGGRLDRWLHSCRYPNLSLTGLRDFEHLVACHESSSRLYHFIGTHLLSLLLVAGSYFRNRNPERIGFDQQGQHVDTRDLFDRPLLKRLIEGIFGHYYSGFAGTEYVGIIPFNTDDLALRMIDEMGVDRHMEEILRVADQEAMTDQEFQDFLMQRGYSMEQAKGLERGTGDLLIHTGPHLGAFNNRISLPELIDSVAIASALCVAGRYQQERTASAP